MSSMRSARLWGMSSSARQRGQPQLKPKRADKASRRPSSGRSCGAPRYEMVTSSPEAQEDKWNKAVNHGDQERSNAEHCRHTHRHHLRHHCSPYQQVLRCNFSAACFRIHVSCIAAMIVRDQLPPLCYRVGALLLARSTMNGCLSLHCL